MQKITYKSEKGLKGTVTIPSDKSISHRAIMFTSLARGKSVIKNFSKGQDPLSSLKVCKTLGIDAEFSNEELIVKSKGILSAPQTQLDCGNSGTTMRLMSGILAGQNFNSTLTGDESLSKQIVRECFENGLILERAGRENSVVKIMPPLTIDEETLLKGLNILNNSIKKILTQKTKKI